MLLTFIGTNASGYVEYFGYRFETGNPVRVENADALARLARHPEFAIESEAHPLDHDGDGVPGGSLPGEQSTRRRGRKRKAKSADWMTA